MPKAEVGSTKYLSNKMRSKGLTRLRWYCQVCQKACRDANAFKMHTQSESHVRQMLVVGEDAKKFINDYSSQFQHDFLQLLRTGHGEKEINMNRFYQEYIANKDHIHMNATKWPSLTEFAKHLSREGICRVEDKEDKGLFISWIDNSPEALRRQEALRRKDAQDRGNEEVEQMMIREQIRRAQKAAEERGETLDEEETENRELKRQEGEKITLSFGAKPAPKTEPSASSRTSDGSAAASAVKDEKADGEKPTLGGGLTMKITAKPQTKNVFAAAKKNALGGGSKKPAKIEQPKKMSEAERIMKEDMERMERKRARDASGGGAGASSWKKQKTDQIR